MTHHATYIEIQRLYGNDVFEQTPRLGPGVLFPAQRRSKRLQNAVYGAGW